MWYYDIIPLITEEPTTIISKGDTYINDGFADSNYGVNTTMLVGKTAGNDIRRILFEIKMPPEPENAGRIRSVDLELYQTACIPAGGGTINIMKCDDDYIANSATWNKPDGVNDWTNRDGTAKLGYTSTTDTNNSSYIEFGLFRAPVLRDGLTWGGTYDVILIVNGEPAGTVITFSTMEAAAAQRPRLEIKYEEKQPEIPDGEEEILTIEPNPNNPTQSLLKWEKPENLSLRIDNSGGYCLVKSETIIDAITDGTLIARLNQGEEYVDTGGVLATTENNLYYYKLYFCSEHNYIAGTGTGLMSGMTVYGTPIASNQVWMIRPDVSTFVFDVTVGANYEYDVKDLATATITAVVAGDFALTPSPVQHTHYQFDWKGDSTESGWVELETPANSHAKTHYYLGYQGATSAKARIQNSLGFWSDATNSGKPVKIDAITGIAVVNVSPKAMTTSEAILRTLGDQSYARSSNETITKYEFRVVRSTDSYEWDFDKAPTPDWIVTSPTWNDLTTTPYMDIPAGDMDTAATYTCYCRITTSSFGLCTTPVSTTMTVTTETSVNMKTTLTNSVFKMHNLGAKRAKSRHRVIEGTTEIVIDAGREMPQIRISGDSFGVNFQTDYNQLITWRDADTLLKVYTDPQAGTPAKYIEGWIDNLMFSKRLSESIHWECTLVSKTASL